MAGPALSRWPTCLGCLRKVAVGGTNASAGTNNTSIVVSMMQTRAKSNTRRPVDQGVTVRLLEDIPKFGRKEAIFRVERGRMRNEWFPRKKAEYMTAARFQELGISKADIGERDRSFVIFKPVAEEPAAAPKPVQPTANKGLSQLAPEKALVLLSSLVPETLSFYRKPIQAPVPAPAAPPETIMSPLISSSSKQNQTAIESKQAPLEIYGSVSATDIVTHIKEMLVADAEASRILLEPGNITFLGLEEGADRIKMLGRWEVEISTGGTGLEPVRKRIEILPQQTEGQ
ncbi:hypothetical protein B0H63DRAFT_461458 [Podospora didyma]|uniref:Ribosomal protein L9 domain-containing protein n=1 Tax=Podospora didyma TaxID=330526 RepID=A0AAE0P7D7_9PEZI|nr:hypothetical protein B0H63DRAFT_461458 [Podospora didyma]